MNTLAHQTLTPVLVETRLRELCDSLESRLRRLSLEGATTACGTTERDEPNFAAFGHYRPANLRNTWVEIKYPDCVVSVIHKVWRDPDGRQHSVDKGYVSDFSVDALDIQTQRAALDAEQSIERRFGRFEIPSANFHCLSFDFDEPLARALFKGLERLGKLSGIAA